MIIDHICFAVKDLQMGIENWRKSFGYVQLTEVVTNTRQKVRVVFLTKKNSITIKLIEPLDENKSVSEFIQRGGSFHHLCFKCDNVYETMEDMKDKGMVTLVPPQPGEAFENEDIAFMLTRFGINFELIDTDMKANQISR